MRVRVKALDPLGDWIHSYPLGCWIYSCGTFHHAHGVRLANMNGILPILKLIDRLVFELTRNKHKVVTFYVAKNNYIARYLKTST